MSGICQLYLKLQTNVGVPPRQKQMPQTKTTPLGGVTNSVTSALDSSSSSSLDLSRALHTRKQTHVHHDAAQFEESVVFSPEEWTAAKALDILTRATATPATATTQIPKAWASRM